MTDELNVACQLCGSPPPGHNASCPIAIRERNTEIKILTARLQQAEAELAAAKASYRAMSDSEFDQRRLNVRLKEELATLRQQMQIALKRENPSPCGQPYHLAFHLDPATQKCVLCESKRQERASARDEALAETILGGCAQLKRERPAERGRKP